MCGIGGVWNLDGRPVAPEFLAELKRGLAHRGPDGAGEWVGPDGALGLVHTRLSIIDLSEQGLQPMQSRDGQSVIVFNGEIYNYLELRRELQSLGHAFNTSSDTEVLLAVLQHWGVGGLSRLNGMWALALYDVQRREMLLARDRFGVKPLYYHSTAASVMFASEVRALHRVLGRRHPLNNDVLADIAHGGFASHGTKETWLKDVYALPAGYIARIDRRGVSSAAWYGEARRPVSGSLPDHAAELRGLLIDACRLRLRSDVPVATCLSGGLDSGSITAVINKFLGQDTGLYTHRSFCVSFPNTPIDEVDGARELASVVGSKLEVLPLGPPLPAQLEGAMAQCDGPMHSLAFYPISELYRFIRASGIRVTLDGQGPDEMLGGYRPLAPALHAALDARSPARFLDVYQTYAALGDTPQFSSRLDAKRVAKAVLKARVKGPIRALAAGLGLWKTGTASSSPGFQPLRAPPTDLDALQQELHRQFHFNPLPGILQQYDRCSMAHAVECRMPFMDFRVVEFLMSLPGESRVGRGYTKLVLRRAMDGVVPDGVRLNKVKIGFNAPIVDWFRGTLREWMSDQMETQQFLNCELFSGPQVRGAFHAFLREERPSWDVAWQFWPAVHLAWWRTTNGV